MSILMLILFIFIVALIFRQDVTVKRINVSKFLFKIYGTALVLATIIYFLFPLESATVKKYEKPEIMNYMQEEDKFYAALSEGKFLEVDGLTKIKTWEFPMDVESFDLRGPTDGMMIVAEEKEENDHQVEVVFYSTKDMVDQVDLTKLIPAPTIVQEQDDVIRIKQNYINIKFANMGNEFTINQFKREKRDFFSHSTVMGEDILLLRIPKGVEFDNSFVNYIKN